MAGQFYGFRTTPRTADRMIGDAAGPRPRSRDETKLEFAALQGLHRSRHPHTDDWAHALNRQTPDKNQLAGSVEESGAEIAAHHVRDLRSHNLNLVVNADDGDTRAAERAGQPDQPLSGMDDTALHNWILHRLSWSLRFPNRHLQSDLKATFDWIDLAPDGRNQLWLRLSRYDRHGQPALPRLPHHHLPIRARG